MTKDYYIIRILKLLNLDPNDPENDGMKERLSKNTVLQLITMIEEYKKLDHTNSFSSRFGASDIFC